MSDETKSAREQRRDDAQHEEQEAAKRREDDAKRTFTVKSPNPNFSGESAGVQFRDGEGVVGGDNYAALLYFQNHPAYEVTSGGDLPDEDEDIPEWERTERQEHIDRTTARDAVKHPDEAVSWGDRKSAKDFVDDTPATNGFGEDGEGVPVGARTPVGSLKGDATTHGEVQPGPNDAKDDDGDKASAKPATASRRTASKPATASSADSK